MRRLIFIVGQQCSGKTTVLRFIDELFPGKFVCFDIGEVIRGWMREHDRDQKHWIRQSLKKNYNEGFGWIFERAIKSRKRKARHKDARIVISGNRILNFRTHSGSINFLEECRKFYCADEQVIVYLKSCFRSRFERNRTAREKLPLPRRDFVNKDRLDNSLGLWQLCRMADFVIANDGNLGKLKSEISSIFGALSKKRVNVNRRSPD